jgi:hypothetical protein
VYEIVDDHTIMEKAKQALRQNANRTKDCQPQPQQAVVFPETTVLDQDIDLEPLPFSRSGYSGGLPVSSSCSTSAAALANQPPLPQIQQQHQATVTTTGSQYYGRLPPGQPSTVSCSSGSSVASPSYASSVNYSSSSFNKEKPLAPSYVAAVTYSSSGAAIPICQNTNSNVHGAIPPNSNAATAAFGAMGFYDDQPSESESTTEEECLTLPSPSFGNYRTNSMRGSLTIEQVFDPKQQLRATANYNSGFAGIDELSTSMSNVNVNGDSARTNALMASAETLGTIEQYGSATDMSITSSTLSFFTRPGGSSATETGVPARHAVYTQSEVTSQPLDSPPDGFLEASATIGGSQCGRQESSKTTSRLSRASTKHSTDSSMSLDGLFDSRNKSSTFDAVYANARKQAEQEYPSLTAAIFEESSVQTFVPMGQSTIDAITALVEDSDQQLHIPPPANDQRSHYYQQDTE